MMDKRIESLTAAVFKQAIKDIKKYPEQKDTIISELENSIWSDMYDTEYIISRIERISNGKEKRR